MRRKLLLFILLSIVVPFTGNFSLAIADNRCQLPAVTNYFGDALRACLPARAFGSGRWQAGESTYFEFTHNYDCSNANTAVSSLDAETKTRLYAMGLKDTDLVCAFTPKVQVLDNWGWCNGDCADEDDLDGDGNQTELLGGCYNNEGITKTKQCDTKFGAWREYKGKIIVVPSK